MTVATAPAQELTFRRAEATFRVALGPLIATGGAGVVQEGHRLAGPELFEPVVVKRARDGAHKLLDIERRVCEQLDHPNLVRYLGAAATPEHGMLLAFERLAQNPLMLLNGAGNRPAFRDPKGLYYPLPPGTALELGHDLLRGIEHLHARGYVHGDVKLANFLVRTPEPTASAPELLAAIARGAFEGVLIDLSSLRPQELLDRVRRAEVDPELDPAITPLYAPPEVLVEHARAHGKITFSPAMDVYSFALVLYVFLTGRAPYDLLCKHREAQHPDVLNEIKLREARGDLAPFDEAALDNLPLHDVAFVGSARTGWPIFRSRVGWLLRACTHPDPARRLTAAAARAFLEGELRLRPAEAGAPRRWTQGLFRMRPLANRLVQDAPRGGIRVRLEGPDAVGEEAAPPRVEPAAAKRPVIALREAEDDQFRDSAEALEERPASSRRPRALPLRDLLKQYHALRRLPVRAPVVVTSMSLHPRDLARARVFSLPDHTARLSRKPVRIGRGDECDLILDDASVSRVHAALELEGEAWTVRDLASQNGTYLDGRVLPREQRRRVAATFAAIRLGNAQLAILGANELVAYLDHAMEVLRQACQQRSAKPRVAPAAPGVPKAKGPAGPPPVEPGPRLAAQTLRVARPSAQELARTTELEVLVDRLRAHGKSSRFFLTFLGGGVHVLGSAEETLAVARAVARPVLLLEAWDAGREPVVLFQREAVAA